MRLSSGPLSMLLGYAALGVMPVMVRRATHLGWRPAEVVVARFVVACGLALLIGLFTRQGLRTHNRRALFWRGACGGAAAILYFFSLETTHAGTATLLNTSYSLWANLFAWAFLGQRQSRAYWVLLALALGGVWLVVDPSLESFRWGELLALASGILGGVSVLSIKELRRTDNALTIFASFSVFGLLGGITLLGSAGPASNEAVLDPGWMVLLNVAVLSFLGQFLFTHGYRDTSVELGTALALLVPLVAALSGWLWLGERLTASEVTGGTVVLAACTLTGLMERKRLKA